MAEIITVSAQKGGCLKTSITVNLAAHYAFNGKRVLIVDLDSQGNASLSFGINPDEKEMTIYDVMLQGESFIHSLEQVYDSIDMSVSNDDMNFFEFDLLMNSHQYDNLFLLLNDALDSVKKEYDYILIDTPPTLSLVQGNALACADQVIIPFQPEPYSMRSLQKMVDAINKMKKEVNPRLNILGVVPTLVDKRTKIHHDIIDKCREYCEGQGIYFCDTHIPKSIMYVNTMAEHGLPATFLYKKGNKQVMNVYPDLFDELNK